MMILTKLILAHLIGDFLLQPKSWVAQKETHKLKSNKLYVHVLIHGSLYFLFLWNFAYWYIPLILAGFHLLIDALKLCFQTSSNKRFLFFIDQLFHIASIVGVYWFFFTPAIQFNLSADLLLYSTGALFLTTPASIAIKMLISPYKPKTEIEKNESLENAGKYIGMLERLLVFVFIVTNHWEGVGFLIAAKSIFRFSDLTESKDRKLTEYILIGTLLSFGMAICTGIFILYTL